MNILGTFVSPEFAWVRVIGSKNGSDDELPNVNLEPKKKVKFDEEPKKLKQLVEESVREKYFNIFQDHNKDKLNELSSNIIDTQKFYMDSAKSFQEGFEKLESTLKTGFGQIEQIFKENQRSQEQNYSTVTRVSNDPNRFNLVETPKPTIPSNSNKFEQSLFGQRNLNPWAYRDNGLATQQSTVSSASCSNTSFTKSPNPQVFETSQSSNRKPEESDSELSSENDFDSDEDELEQAPLQYSEVPALFVQSRSIPHFAVLLKTF